MRAERAPGLLAEEGEQAELARRQAQRLAAERDVVGGEVDHEVADAADRSSRLQVELPAAQDRPHAADQLGDRERLADVVVSPGLEPQHAVGLRVAGGDDHDRHVAGVADPAAPLEPAEPGQCDVEDQQRETTRADVLEHRCAVVGGLDREPFAAQRVRQRAAAVRDRAKRTFPVIQPSAGGRRDGAPGLTVQACCMRSPCPAPSGLSRTGDESGCMERWRRDR